jgi:nitrogen fixation protein FixH
MSEAIMDKTLLRRWIGNDRWIPWVYVAGMLIVFAVNGVLILFALRSFPGLSVDAPFQRGVQYNRVLAEAEKQAALGWQIKAAFAGDRNGLVIEAFDRDGHALADLDIAVRISRPVEAMAEIPVALRYAGAGRYVGVVELPKSGQWDVHIDATARTGARVQITRRLVQP